MEIAAKSVLVSQQVTEKLCLQAAQKRSQRRGAHFFKHDHEHDCLRGDSLRNDVPLSATPHMILFQQPARGKEKLPC